MEHDQSVVNKLNTYLEKSREPHAAMPSKGAGYIDIEMDGGYREESPLKVSLPDKVSGASAQSSCVCATVLIVNQEALANYNVKMVLQHSLDVTSVDLANTMEHAFLQFKD